VLLVDPLDRRFDRPGVHPRQEAEGEEVLGPLGVARLDPQGLGGLEGDRRHGDLDDPKGGEGAVLEGTGLVAGLVEAALLEGVRVDEHRPGRLELADVRPQRRRVHGHEHAGHVARGEDLVVRDVDLERGNPGDGAGRGSNLCWEVRHRRQVAAEGGAHVAEPVAGQLHPVAGVAGEADDDTVERLGFQVGDLGSHTSSLVVGGARAWRSLPGPPASPGTRAEPLAIIGSEVREARTRAASEAEVSPGAPARPRRDAGGGGESAPRSSVRPRRLRARYARRSRPSRHGRSGGADCRRRRSAGPARVLPATRVDPRPRAEATSWAVSRRGGSPRTSPPAGPTVAGAAPPARRPVLRRGPGWWSRRWVLRAWFLPGLPDGAGRDGEVRGKRVALVPRGCDEDQRSAALRALTSAKSASWAA